MSFDLTGDLLGHVAQYRLTTPAAIAKLYDLGDDVQALKILEGLRSHGYLDRALLRNGKPYFYLLPPGAEFLGAEGVKTGPVNGGQQAVAYAVLYFCCLDGAFRPKIPTKVFLSRFAPLYRPGPHIQYYTQGSRLGYLRVETRDTSAGDERRIIESCYRDVRNRTQPKRTKPNRDFQSLINWGSFVVTLLVSQKHRVNRLNTEIEQMRECCDYYHQYLFCRRRHEKAPRQARLEYERWHRRDPQRKRKPPRLPPPMNIKFIPGLFGLIYPKTASRD